MVLFVCEQRIFLRMFFEIENTGRGFNPNATPDGKKGLILQLEGWD